MSDARRILDERLARGEIDDAEYDRLIAKLGASQPEATQSAASSRKPQRIEIEDGVINLEDYDGVRTNVEFITKFNAGVGVIFFVIGPIIGNNVVMLIGVGMFVIALLSFAFTRSVKVQVLKGGTWQDIGKYNYSKAEEIKSHLAANL